MAEALATHLSENETAPTAFQIGENTFSFNGDLTEGEFIGQIRRADGSIFTGLVKDLGGGRWRTEDWEGAINYESPVDAIAEAVPAGPQRQEDSSAVNLDSAAVLASVDAAVPAESQQIDVEIPAAPVSEAALPEVVAVNIPEAVAVERASAETHVSIVGLKQKMQEVYKPLRAARLWKQAEGIKEEIAAGKGGAKARKERMAKMDELRDKARELQPGIEKMAQPQRSELLKKSTPLSAEGPAEAIKMANLKHREDMAAQYEQELQKW